MGTFNLIIDQIGAQTGTWRRSSDGSTDDAAIIGAIASNNLGAIIGLTNYPFTAPPDGSFTISFNIGWFLDGSVTETPFANLPLGFNVTSARLVLRIGQATNNASGYDTDTYKMFFQEGIEERDFSNSPPDTIVPDRRYWFDHDSGAGSGLSSLHLQTDEIGIFFNRPTNINVNTFIWLFVEGVYEIISQTWTITTPGPVKTGDDVTIDGDTDLDEIDTVTIVYTDSLGDMQQVEITVFSVQTPTQLVFEWPNLGDFVGTAAVFLTGDGPDFIGQVSIGTLEVIVANASGIYELVPGKTSDTVYLGAGDDTAEVAIPDPFIKTGYIGG